MVAAYLADTIRYDHLTSSLYAKQTDAVQLAFAVAQMEAETKCQLVMVDGLIETSIQTSALNDGRGIRGYFSQSCHDKGLTCRRIIFFDIVNTQTMSTSATGLPPLHFHGMFLLEPGQDERWLRQRLTDVFGHASNARRFQFKFRNPDNSRSHGYAGQKCAGATGKLAYMLSHVGGTYNRLGLNDDGKRSRKAPIGRGRINAKAKGLARGVPSNFVSKVVIRDMETRRCAEAAFKEWYRNRAPVRSTKPTTAQTIKSSRTA